MHDGKLRRCHLDQVCSKSMEELSVSEVPNSLTDVLPDVSSDQPVEATSWLIIPDIYSLAWFKVSFTGMCIVLLHLLPFQCLVSTDLEVYDLT